MIYAIEEIEGPTLTNGQKVYIEDTYTGLIHDLTQSPFNFTADTGEYNDRFILRFNANQLSTKDVEAQETFAYIKDRVLNIQSSSLIEEVMVYDITGKLVMDLNPNGNTSTLKTDFNFARGAYIVLITLDQEVTVSKKLIN